MIGAKNIYRSDDARVQRLLDQLELKYEIDSDGDFRVHLDAGEAGEGRSQVCFILSKTEQLSSLEIREVFSIGHECDGPLPARVANALLLMNSVMKLGAWRVMRLESGRHLAAFAVQIAANSDAHTLNTALVMVLETADKVEKELSGGDKF